MVEILFYTDNKLDNKEISQVVRDYILKAGLPIISVSLKPIDFGRNIVFNGKRGHSTMFKQILIGLEASKADHIFMCEHDNLYHKSHFDFIPPRDDVYYYNNNVWKYRLSDRKIIGYDCKWLSQCCASRKILIKHYKNKLKAISQGKRAYGYEPGTGQSKYLTNNKADSWKSEYPNIDIRHGKNWTGVDRMAVEEFKNKKNCKNWKEITVNDIKGWDLNIIKKL